MSPRKPERLQPCSRAEAKRRNAHARKFLESAELVALEDPECPESANVAASLAVLAGIAASDAACCVKLGKRSRSQDHNYAKTLLADIAPDGREASKALGRLLSVKDSAQYGFIHVSSQDLRAVLRQARSLIEFADAVLEG